MIYFKDPRIKLHTESWGAVVRTPKGLVLIDSKLLDFYNEFKETIYKTVGDVPKEIKKLLKLGIISMISENKASRVFEK